ncbi:Gfo/Idh/MocA family oxidoreductase [Thalassococcus sp. CAU 1522]|uniref:Gfo/Idh/MocA family oxidoreductase n=1 Tax=Thalassococcus arenae TaxID=2851652 RepID=A0ABS6N9E3_9RHOB|nr:Gfo/Idh/MocA family oxidoreductase [Thalassococcus arenae]MBV2360636.1 Gfo/Idh/MocA family oxidoreductase [Thalassococcus arenae]
MAGLRVITVGLGYFSRFHLDAWQRQDGADLVAVCDLDAERAASVAASRGVAGATDLAALVAEHKPDVVDIVAPPSAHAALIGQVLAPRRTVICQKPFCTSLAEAGAVIDAAAAAGTQIVIHENFRFQPWYRAVKAFLDGGKMGRVWQAHFALRPGDGRGPRAYLDRQPAFQKMERLLIHETAVHFIDLFRWLLGDIETVYTDLRRLNPVIAGEDDGLMILTHAGGARSVFDGNRLADHVAADPRHTMGEFTLEGEAGVLRLDGDGRLSFRAFGSDRFDRVPINDPVDRDAFGGGCVAALIAHVVAAIRQNARPENLAGDYLHVMRACDAAYRSARDARRVDLRAAA